MKCELNKVSLIITPEDVADELYLESVLKLGQGKVYTKVMDRIINGKNTKVVAVEPYRGVPSGNNDRQLEVDGNKYKNKF